MPKCANQNCERDALQGNSFCILHDESAGKNPQEFSKAFGDLIDNSSDIVLLEGITFPGAFSFSYYSNRYKNLDFDISACNASKLDLSNIRNSSFHIHNSYIGSLTIEHCTIPVLRIGSCNIVDFTICTSEINNLIVLSYTAHDANIECINSFFAIDCEFENIGYCHHKTDKFHVAASKFKNAQIIGLHNNSFVVRNCTISDQSTFDDLSSLHLAIANTKLTKPELLTISNSELCCACFIGTNLSEIHFTGNVWTNSAHKRFILFDELYLRGQIPKQEEFGPYIHDISFTKCCELYQQLKCNFEKRGNHSGASDFQYGEMEARRLSNNGIWKHISIYSFYKYISCYGQSYTRPIMLLGCSLIILTALQLYAGFRTENTIIKYDLAFSLPVSTTAIRDFFNALELTLSNVTPIQSDFIQLATIPNTILAIAAKGIILPFLWLIYRPVKRMLHL